MRKLLVCFGIIALLVLSVSAYAADKVTGDQDLPVEIEVYGEFSSYEEMIEALVSSVSEYAVDELTGDQDLPVEIEVYEEFSSYEEMAEAVSSSVSTYTVEKITDDQDLSGTIESCKQFGSYEEIAEALLCAACIPYGESPEQCVLELQNRGFEFEYAIGTELPYNVTTFDVTYDAQGNAELPMMKEVALYFSPTVTLYMRTEAQMVDLKPANDVAGMQNVTMWMPDGDVTEADIISAHLQCFDENTQKWITWTLTSSERYKEAWW